MHYTVAEECRSFALVLLQRIDANVVDHHGTVLRVSIPRRQPSNMNTTLK